LVGELIPLRVRATQAWPAPHSLAFELGVQVRAQAPAEPTHGSRMQNVSA
jgi:hypothetical protein